MSLLFTYLNWNKHSVVIDLRTPSASMLLRPLVTEADIVIETFRPGRLAGWGFGFEQLKRWNPRVVLASLTNFGQTGPRAQDAATDLTFYALSGLSSISGFKDPEHPIKHGLRQGLYGAGMTLAYSALAAHRLARRTGMAQHLDISIHECLASELVAPCAYYSFAGALQGRHPVSPDPMEGMPLKTASGFIAFQVNPRAPISGVAELLALPELADARNEDTDHRVQNAAVIKQAVEERLATRTARDWFIEASGRGLLAGVVQGAAELLDCPQLQERHLFRTVPRGGGIRYPMELARLAKSPVTLRLPAPHLGEHGGVPNAAMWAGSSTTSRSDESGSGSEKLDATLGPLAGVRVVELASLISVPYVGALLADLGAEVIKVEGPRRIDPLRYSFTPLLDNELGEDPWNRAGSFHMLNRGKKSFVCDLGTAEGQNILRGLLAQSDVMIENFTPSVLRKWGLTPDALENVNPRLISMSNSGFGATGPWSNFKAQGTTLEMTMGPSAYTGYENSIPLKAGQSYPDFLACWSALLAILAALSHRDRTGQGQHIDQGMYQLGSCVIPEAFLHYQHYGRECGRHGAEDFQVYVSGIFRLASGGWIALSIATPGEADRLATLVPTLRAGLDRPAALRSGIQAWVGAENADTVEQVCRTARIAAGRVNNVSDLYQDPHLGSRKFFEQPEGEISDISSTALIGRPFKFTEAVRAARVRGAAPNFGDHNLQILRDLLHFDADTIAGFYRAGIVADEPQGAFPFKPIDYETRIRKGTFDRLDENFRAVCRPARSA